MRHLLATGACLAVLACTAETPGSATPSTTTEPAAEATCPNNGPRFAVTGLCVAQSISYLDQSIANAPGDLPEGCVWTMNETGLAGDEALLYQAATCNGATTKLAFAGGAKSASISYETSALGGDAVKGQEMIRLFTAPVEDPQANLKQIIAEDPEAKDCVIRPAGVTHWPADALVIAPTDEARAKMPTDEPISACGRWGLDEDSTRYWVIRQGYAWFFDLGQDTPDFSERTMVLMRKDAGGAWSVAK